jgi:tetratricopeptide (TPR) repeat protein
MNSISDTKLQHSKSKVIAFKVLSFTLVIFAFILIEISFRLFSVGNNMHLIINHPNKLYKAYYSVNPNIGLKYFNKFEATGGTNDIFLKNKPENGFRIFVLGSSSMVGFPYEKNLMASRILYTMLKDAYPNKHVEVVNTAITAINSITLNDYMKEIVNYEPDAILFYAGHNEYYGAFGVGSHETMSKNVRIRNFHFTLMNSRLYQVLRSLYTKISTGLSKKPDVANARGSLMKRIVADKDIVYGSDKYRVGINQFKVNVSQILELAENKQIPVFISDLVSNVKDLAPLSLQTGQTDDTSATYFKKAITALSVADYEQAQFYFYKAKDYDPIRFRASEQINDCIDSLNTLYKGYKITALQSFQNASQFGLIGNNLLTEHVHPNIEGQFLMAQTFFNAIKKSGLIDSVVINKNLESYKTNWGYTVLDSLIGEYRIKQLKSYWPFASLESTVTFRDTHKVTSVIDSLAYSVLLSSTPNVEKMHEFMANRYLNQGQLEQALKEYIALIGINPYWSYYYNKAADVLLKLNDLYAAEQLINESMRFTPTYFTFLMKAEMQMLKHDFESAIIFYGLAREHSESDEDKAKALEKLYLAYTYSGQLAELKSIEKQLNKLGLSIPATIPTLDFTYTNYLPFNVKASIQKAGALMAIQKYDSAQYILKQALAINNCPLVNRLMGDALLLKHDKQLLSYYSVCFDTFQNDPAFLSNYCIANYVNHNFAKAKTTLKKIKELKPDYPGIASLDKMLEGK